MNQKPILLAVDDDPRILRALRLVLQREWDVVGVASTGEALGLVALGLEPDAILIELDLAVENGLLLMEELPPRLQRRVVFTSHHGSTQRSRALDTTRALILAKPIQLDTLEMAIEDTRMGRLRLDRLVA